jgi:hypothetical protein
VPFGTISRRKAPKLTLVGRGTFKIPAGKTGKIKVELTATGRAILRHKHVLNLTVETVLKLAGGKTGKIESKVTIKLKR